MRYSGYACKMWSVGHGGERVMVSGKLKEGIEGRSKNNNEDTMLTLMS